MQKLSSNFYYCLSPPTCQVNDHETSNTPPNRLTNNKDAGLAAKRQKKLTQQHQWEYILDIDDMEFKEGIATGLIQTTIADSTAVDEMA